jgi:uncharacterized membrane-anchored protein YitT (DUF2179 family)
MKKNFVRYMTMGLGCLLMALAINCFFVRFQFLSGGLSGLSLILYYVLHWPVGVTTIIMNIPLFYAAYRFMSRRFFIDSLFGTVLFSFLLEATTFLSTREYVSNPLLACIAGGVMEGLGSALVYRVEGSTGGVDILGFLAKKYYNISISSTSFAFNAVVVTAAIIFIGLEPVLYSMVIFFIAFKATNIGMVGLDYKKSVFIVSNKQELIKQRIITEVNRGITVLHGQGGYTNKDMDVLLVVVKITQLGHLLKIIEQTDKTAFVMVQDANDVFGRGFTQPDLLLPPIKGKETVQAASEKTDS